MLLQPLTFHIDVLSWENTWQEASFVTLRFALHRQWTHPLFLCESTQPIRWLTQTSQSPTSGVRVLAVQQQRPDGKCLTIFFF